VAREENRETQVRSRSTTNRATPGASRGDHDGSHMTIVDLRSDLLARVTPAMLRAMCEAAGGRTEFELRGDPYQAALENRLAELLGQEDALIFPTCTMANEVALQLLASPGETIAVPRDVHILSSEANAPAALGGLHVAEVPGDPPLPPPEAWEAMARGKGNALNPRVAAFSIENTHNRSGGAVISPEAMAGVLAVARRHGVNVHLDGSRLLNAAVALRCEPKELAGACDTVSISLNKGLGAPIGAALAGSKATIARALRLRQRLGGGIRPTAIPAAATMAALEDWRRIGEDHRRATKLAEGLARLPGIKVLPPQTNIVAVEIVCDSLSPEALCQRLAENGVLVIPFGARRVRMVVYGDIDDAAVDHAVRVTAQCL
jgi:threonine aldolase